MTTAAADISTEKKHTSAKKTGKGENRKSRIEFELWVEKGG